MHLNTLRKVLLAMSLFIISIQVLCVIFEKSNINNEVTLEIDF